MLTLAPPDSLQRWHQLVVHEEESGGIPLPAVDSIILEGGEYPRIVLLSRELGDDVPHLVVRLAAMPPAAHVTLNSLLTAIESMSGMAGLGAVYHLGGLDYGFSSSSDDDGSTRLMALDASHQATLWGLLHALALLCERYPDREASTPKSLLPQVP